MPYLSPRILLAVAASLITAVLVSPLHISAQENDSWMKDWAVSPGFALDVAVEGLNFPTAIAFVPEPGSDPKDPALFITELEGAVKVVSNDGTLQTFANGFFNRASDFTGGGAVAETGLVDICLAPDQGYVFVTYAYVHEDGLLRNAVGRFDTNPGTFSVQPESFQEFRWAFINHESNESHQIGSCQILEDHLFVSVGDGRRAEESVNLDSSLGKVLRMTFDGLPSPDNPHYTDGVKSNPINYVYARGFRNPFGLAAAGDRLFVTDNGGISDDKFVEVEPGGNYLWDGSRSSFLSVTDLMLNGSFGVGQFDFYPAGLDFFPNEFDNNFFIVQTSSPVQTDKTRILRFKYGLDERRPLSIPEAVLEHRGDQIQVIVGATFGPDGLYVVPLLPSEDGVSRIFRMTHDPLSAHPYLINPSDQPMDIIRENGCLGCHALGDENLEATAPTLDPNQLVPRLTARLSSSEYEADISTVDSLDREPFSSYQDVRAQILQLEGTDQARLWLENRLREPRFDDPNAKMPKPNLTEAEIQILVDFLVPEEEPSQADPVAEPEASLADQIRARLPNPMGLKHLASFLLAGAVVGWLSMSVVFVAIRYLRSLDRGSGDRANSKNP